MFTTSVLPKGRTRSARNKTSFHRADVEGENASLGNSHAGADHIQVPTSNIGTRFVPSDATEAMRKEALGPDARHNRPCQSPLFYSVRQSLAEEILHNGFARDPGLRKLPCPPVGPLLTDNIYSPWRWHLERGADRGWPLVRDDSFTDEARTFAVIFFHGASNGAAAAAISLL